MTPSRFRTQAAINTLRLGGVIAYPTEAVYGLGCDPHDLSALRRILQLKQRAPNMGFILIADTIERASPYFVTSKPSTK